MSGLGVKVGLMTQIISHFKPKIEASILDKMLKGLLKTQLRFDPDFIMTRRVWHEFGCTQEEIEYIVQQRQEQLRQYGFI